MSCVPLTLPLYSVHDLLATCLSTCTVVFQPENENISECMWLMPILQDSLRHIYQRFILESDGDVVEMAYKVMYNYN